MREERVCGNCCWFLYEDIDGVGICAIKDRVSHCGDPCVTGGHVSEREKRHHLAMLRKCQRCLAATDKQDVDVEQIREAIDFVVKYAKLCCL